MCVGDRQITALRARGRIEGNAAKAGLGTLGEAHGAGPVVMPGEPESVDRAVEDEWVEVIDPGVLRICLGLRGEWGRQREKQKTYARVNR